MCLSQSGPSLPCSKGGEGVSRHAFGGVGVAECTR